MTMEDKQYEEHVKQTRLVMQQERYINLARLLNMQINMQIEYMKEQMNDFEEKNKWKHTKN